MNLRSLLVATDFSADARKAALRAASLAREHGATSASLLHVQSRSLFPQEALEARAQAGVRQQLARLARQVKDRTGFEFDVRTETGSVSDVVLAASKSADLVCVGARGLHPLRELSIGTTAERLVRRLRNPMLVVKQLPHGPYARVLVPVDFSPASRAALSLAAALAPGSALHALHVSELPFEGKLRYAGVEDSLVEQYRAQAREEARAALDDLVGELALRGRVSARIGAGYVPAAISSAERALRADLVVLGKQGRSALEHLLIGSVTLHVLANARCDVLVVPAPPATS